MKITNEIYFKIKLNPVPFQRHSGKGAIQSNYIKNSQNCNDRSGDIKHLAILETHIFPTEKKRVILL